MLAILYRQFAFTKKKQGLALTSTYDKAPLFHTKEFYLRAEKPIDVSKLVLDYDESYIVSHFYRLLIPNNKYVAGSP